MNLLIFVVGVLVSAMVAYGIFSQSDWEKSPSRSLDVEAQASDEISSATEEGFVRA